MSYVFVDDPEDSMLYHAKPVILDDYPPAIQETDSKGLPLHEFLYKNTMKDDVKGGISLIIKPYVYAKKKSNYNGKTYWYCIHCKKQGCFTSAISIEKLDPDGKPNHELQSADSNHVCNPCPSNYLCKKFMHQLNSSIYENPAKDPRKLYEKIKQDMLDTIDDNVKSLFLSKITKSGNIPKEIKGNVKKRKCAMCDFESFSNDEFKTHMKDMHRGMKPHQCTTCGKVFGSKAKLESHESTGHLIIRGK